MIVEICQKNSLLSLVDNSLVTIYSIPAKNVNPADLLAKLATNQEYAFLFEKGQNEQYAILGFDPLLKVYFDDQFAYIQSRDSNEIEKRNIINPLDLLEEILSLYQAAFSAVSFDLPFLGGFVGYMGYGACIYFDKISQQAKDLYGIPRAYYCFYDTSIVVDYLREQIHIVSLRASEYIEMIVDEINKYCQQNQNELAAYYVNTLNNKANFDQRNIFDQVDISFSKKEYEDAFEQCKELIKQGEVFQIVLAQRFSLECTADPLDVYKTLAFTNPSPYQYYLRFPDFIYIGSSPETFLCCENGTLSLAANCWHSAARK